MYSYNFLNNTNTSLTTDFFKYDDYSSEIHDTYIEFDYGFSLTHMRILPDNDIANHIKEINNDVTHVNFDKIYFYEHRQIVVNQFDKIFQGIIDKDPFVTFNWFINNNNINILF